MVSHRADTTHAHRHPSHRHARDSHPGHHTHAHTRLALHRHPRHTRVTSLKVIQAEATGCAHRLTAGAGRKMPIAIGIAAAGGDVRRVEDVGVDELDFCGDLEEELRMALLDVLAPEIGRFEELRADLGGTGGSWFRWRWWDFAAELGGVLLLDELRQC